jgi:hypothetical protein
VLLEKDFGPAIRSGFETTGLYPFSVEKAIAKLPVELEQREVDSDVQRTLLKTLEAMRHNVSPPRQRPGRKRRTNYPRVLPTPVLRRTPTRRITVRPAATRTRTRSVESV